MDYICEKQRCVDCKACASVCPVGAITFTENTEGFEYPRIDHGLCMDCGLCRDACPAIMRDQTDGVSAKTYAARISDRQVLENSSSGGIFFALAKKVLECDGVVYGVIFDQKMYPTYARGERIEEILPMMGSKYVDAYLPQILLEQALMDLSDDRMVLFTGTPCAIAGVRSSARLRRISCEKMILCDFYQCSGKVSRRLWTDELQTHILHGRMPTGVSFRDKSRGWENYGMKFSYSNGVSYYTDFPTSKWSKFLGNPASCRECCEICGYDGANSVAD